MQSKTPLWATRALPAAVLSLGLCLLGTSVSLAGSKGFSGSSLGGSSYSRGGGYYRGGGGRGIGVGTAIGIGLAIGAGASQVATPAPAETSSESSQRKQSKPTKSKPTRSASHRGSSESKRPIHKVSSSPDAVILEVLQAAKAKEKAKQCPEEKQEPCPQFPNSQDVDEVAPRVGPDKAAITCNYHPGHVIGLLKTSMERGELIIARANKRDAVRWYDDMAVQPKPVSLKDKTDCGVVRDKDGHPYHSDIDLFLVLKQAERTAENPRGWSRETIDWDDTRNEPDSFQYAVNQNLRHYTGIDKDFVQHGDQVSLLTTGFAQMPPEPLEKFLITEPDGTVRVICGEQNLKAFLRLREIVYPISADGSREAFLQNDGLREFYGIRSQPVSYHLRDQIAGRTPLYQDDQK